MPKSKCCNDIIFHKKEGFAKWVDYCANCGKKCQPRETKQELILRKKKNG